MKYPLVSLTDGDAGGDTRLGPGRDASSDASSSSDAVSSWMSSVDRSQIVHGSAESLIVSGSPN